MLRPKPPILTKSLLSRLTTATATPENHVRLPLVTRALSDFFDLVETRPALHLVVIVWTMLHKLADVKGGLTRIG